MVAERLRGCVRRYRHDLAGSAATSFSSSRPTSATPPTPSSWRGASPRPIKAPYDLHGQLVMIDASIGIAIGPADGTDANELLKNADMALYGAKADGRGVYRFFEPKMDARMKERRMLELALRKAFDNGEFELYYQPVLQSGQRRRALLRGAAALAPSRTRHGVASRIHSDRRGDRIDRRAWRVGHQAGLRGRGAVGRRRHASRSICRRRS